MEGTRICSILQESRGLDMTCTDKEEQLKKEDSIPSLTKNNSISLLDTDLVEEEPVKSDLDIDQEAKSSLSYLQSLLFATLLEDSLTELRILVECNNELRIIKTMSDMGLLLSLKYGVGQPTFVDELENIDPKKLDSNENKIYKLDADRNLVISAISKTYVDLSLNGTFTPLDKQVNDIVNRDMYRIYLEEDLSKNKLFRRDLRRQLRQQRNHIKSVIYDIDVTISNLKTQVEDSILMDECRSRYMSGWQNARTEQHLQIIGNIESVPNEQIEYYKLRSEHEQRVHAEVELLVNITINETLQKIEEWMSKYDKDMENIDLKIQIKRNEYQSILEKRIKLEDTLEKHAKIKKEWIHFKDEREKARLYGEKMTKSAIMVQAWWRGLLVRRRLGPYKVHKIKEGKKGKK